MTELSNVLADLAERVKAANSAADTAQRKVADRLIEAGQLLTEGKAACAHGEWLPFLRRAGIGERRAQQLMQVVRSGLNPQQVSYLGGLRATLSHLAERRLPGLGQSLLVAQKDAYAGEDASIAIIEPLAEHVGYFSIVVYDPASGDGSELVRPVRGEPIQLEDGRWFHPVWDALDGFLNIPLSERQYRLVMTSDLEDDCAFLQDPNCTPGDDRGMPASYIRALEALEKCRADFSPEAFLIAGDALSTVVRRMEHWPSDKRMLPVYNRIAGDQALTQLTAIVSRRAVEDLSHA